jgi:hypothetical protein
MAGLAERPGDGLQDFFERQVQRIHRNTQRALDESRERRQQRLRTTYAEMEAEARIPRHASGPRRPDMDSQGMRQF